MHATIALKSVNDPTTLKMCGFHAAHK